MDQFLKLDPLYFDSYPAVDARDFFDMCDAIQRNLGLTVSNGVDLTTIQLRGPVKKQWQTYEQSRLAGSFPLTWTHFSNLFLENFIPLTRREELCRLEHL